MTEYEKIIDKMVKKYPHARAAFQYFLEQSHYDTMEEFLFDYGYLIDYDLEKYTENEYFYIDGMNNLYYDTIKRRRTQRSSDGDTIYRYIHSEDDAPIEPEVDMEYTISAKITEKNGAKGIVFSVNYQDSEINPAGWTFFWNHTESKEYKQLAKNTATIMDSQNFNVYAIKGNIQTETALIEVGTSEDVEEQEPPTEESNT